MKWLAPGTTSRRFSGGSDQLRSDSSATLTARVQALVLASLVFGDRIAGYANYGRNRARSLHFEGEIYELYLRPEFQGLGFGRRLFAAARRDLMQSGLKSMVIWALSDNEPATEFYRALGGRMVARSSERFGPKSLDKVAFAWAN